MARHYEAYLFDLDGTLVDTAPDIMAGLNVSLAAHGYPLVDEALTRNWVGHGIARLIEQALAHHGKPMPPQALCESMLKRFRDHYRAHIADLGGPYPGVLDALDALSGQAALAVVTNKPGFLTAPLLEALDLARYFGATVAGDTLARPKPAPDPALHACEVLGVDIRRALFVGDSVTDVQCARAAGCDVVCVRGGYSHGIAPERLGADRVIDSLRGLIPVAPDVATARRNL